MLTDGITQTGYLRIYNFFSDEVWDETNQVMDALASVAVADCGIAIPFSDVHQLGTITLPAALPDETVYVLKLYNKAVADASNNDSPSKTLWVFKNKYSVELFSGFQYPIRNR